MKRWMILTMTKSPKPEFLGLLQAAVSAASALTELEYKYKSLDSTHRPWHTRQIPLKDKRVPHSTCLYALPNSPL